MESSWNDFIQEWRNAVKSGTSERAYKNFRDSNDISQYYFYAKTGTPANEKKGKNTVDNVYYILGKDENGIDKKIWLDEGIFVFGITNRDNEKPKGVVGVVFIRRITDEKSNKIGSSQARDFLTADLYRKIIFYNKNRFNR
jgi:hypothetical protein